MKDKSSNRESSQSRERNKDRDIRPEEKRSGSSTTRQNPSRESGGSSRGQ